MIKLLIALLVSSFGPYAFATQLDATDDLSACVWKKLPARDSSWLSMGSLGDISFSTLPEWGEAVAKRIPEDLRRELALSGKRALAGSEFKLEELNQFHDRLLEEFRTRSAESLAIEHCGETTVVADFVYAAVVSRFGTDVRLAPASVRSRYEEAGPFAKYYTGNVTFVWVALKLSGIDISLEQVLDLYSPNPERVRLFLEAEHE